MPPNKICEVCSTYVDCDWILNRVEYDGMLRLKGGVQIQQGAQLATWTVIYWCLSLTSFGPWTDAGESQ